MKVKTKQDAELRRKLRVRQNISGTAERPRLTVCRSLNHVYGQIIDDEKGITLVSASSMKGVDASGMKKSESAKEVGKIIARKALEKGIKDVVFDRGGLLYHGRIKAVADGAREEGLNF
ncbi:50S ribosomal protein L18 [bacterium]|nr:50S ribosomal protein L18 [bacterium]MBU1754193.1 50S ribosomal protein L18 [bacterium]